MMMKQVLEMFECCRLIKGSSFSLLIDLQRVVYRRIPNQLSKLIHNGIGKTLDDIKKDFNNEYDSIIEENIGLLVDEEFMFYTNNPNWFPKMSMEWDAPAALTNGIIDISPKNLHDFTKTWKQLSDLGCEHIQIRSYNHIQIEKIEEILNQIGDKRIISIELIIPYDQRKSDQQYIDFVYRQPRIFTLILHSALEEKVVFISPTKMGHVFYSQSKIKNNSHCGQISKDFFTINIKSFTEAQHHNTCLNRKISIDAEGNIKNCPSMSQSFGNIKDTTLQEALDHPDFKKYWNIKKDDITKCKDCEFRYICTDCRAYIDDPEDIYSAPLKCGYDPYKGEWEEWSTNPLKQKAIDFYGMREILDESIN